MGLLEVRDLELGKAVGEYLAEGPKATVQWSQRLDFRFFFYLWDPRTRQLDGMRLLMQCCATRLLKAFVSWHFIMCFFHVRVGTTSLCWLLFSGWPHLRRILFARLDVPWTTGSRVKRVREDGVEDSEGGDWKTSPSTEISKYHAFFLIIFWQLRFVTLGFYHDQMFRAVFKALEAICHWLKEGPLVSSCISCVVAGCSVHAWWYFVQALGLWCFWCFLSNDNVRMLVFNLKGLLLDC